MKTDKVVLGSIARDTITGYEGVIIGKTEWLNGCVRITLQAKGLKDGKPLETHCVDVEQLELVEAAEPPKRKPAGGPMPSPTRPGY